MDNISNSNQNKTNDDAARSFIIDTHEYNEHAERQLNKEYSIKAESAEQERRLSNPGEESERRDNAKKVSQLFPGRVHAARTPSFAAVVQDKLKSAGTQISASASKVKLDPKKVGKGWASLREKVAVTMRTPKLQNALSEARIAFVNAVVQVIQMAEFAGHKGSEIGHKGGKQLQYASQRLSQQALVIRRTGFHGADFFLVKTTNFVKNITRKFGAWIEVTWANAVYKSNLVIAIHKEEDERKRRVSSDDEVYALLNAIAVSSLIKRLAPEFYRPDEEPNTRYLTKLLESMERNRRMLAHKNDKTLQGKSAHIASLIKERNLKTSTATKELLPAYSVQQVLYPASDSMQIFEEARREIFADFPAKATPETSPAPLIKADDAAAAAGSPHAFVAAM